MIMKNTMLNPELKKLTPEQLFHLGVQDLAYVKPTMDDGIASYAVCTAEGIEVATFDESDVAFAACRQYDLEPVSLH